MKDLKIHQWLVKVSKEGSAFLYFILESNEGLCFYSTHASLEDKKSRVISINCTHNLKQQVQKLLEHFSKENPIEILSCKEIEDKYEAIAP